MTLDPHIFGEAVAGFEKKAMGNQPKPATHDAYGFAKNLPTMRIDPQTGQKVPIQLPEGRHSALGIAGNTVANVGEASGVSPAARTLYSAGADIGKATVSDPAGLAGNLFSSHTLGDVGRNYSNAWNNTPGTHRGAADDVASTRGLVSTFGPTAAVGLGGPLLGRAGQAAKPLLSATGSGLATAGRWLGSKALQGGSRLAAGARNVLGKGVGGAAMTAGALGTLNVAGRMGGADKLPMSPDGAPSTNPVDAISKGLQNGDWRTWAGALGVGGLGAYGLYNMLASRKKKKKRQPVYA